MNDGPLRVLVIRPDGSSEHTAILGDRLLAIQTYAGGYIDGYALNGNASVYYREQPLYLPGVNDRNVPASLLAGLFGWDRPGYIPGTAVFTGYNHRDRTETNVPDHVLEAWRRVRTVTADLAEQLLRLAAPKDTP